MADKRALIDPRCQALPVGRQCELLGLPRSTYYFRPAPVDPYDLALMRLLDEQYTRTPFYGVPRMTAWLNHEGYAVGLKRVRRLLREMGLFAVYPKPRLSMPGLGHKIYPYLLREALIEKPNDVWSTDITYVRMRGGFVYLTAVLDWASRFVLAWQLSTTLETSFCLDALEEALAIACPKIFNTDQGAQFTSTDFTGRLERAKIAISMDGRGRALDNVFVERLWRSVKYEEVYLHEYADVWDAEEHLGRYFEFYNTERLHQSLDYRTPAEVFFDRKNASRTHKSNPPYSSSFSVQL